MACSATFEGTRADISVGTKVATAVGRRKVAAWIFRLVAGNDFTLRTLARTRQHCAGGQVHSLAGFVHFGRQVIATRCNGVQPQAELGMDRGVGFGTSVAAR